MLIGRKGDQSETGTETAEDNMVLHVSGSDNKLLVMKGKEKTRNHSLQWSIQVHQLQFLPK